MQCLKSYQKINLNGKNTSKFNEEFIKNYVKESNKEYVIEAEIEYPKNLYASHNDLPFLQEKIQQTCMQSVQ